MYKFEQSGRIFPSECNLEYVLDERTREQNEWKNFSYWKQGYLCTDCLPSIGVVSKQEKG